MCGLKRAATLPSLITVSSARGKKASAANGLISFDYSRSRRVEKATGKTKERNVACDRPFHCLVTLKI